MLEIGPTKATIKSHQLRTINDKMVVSLQMDTEAGDPCEVNVYLTERSMLIARAQLRACGFSVDTDPLSMLDEKPGLLAGNEVQLLVEDYKGRLKAGILTNPKPTKKKIAEAEAWLRAAKGSADDDIPF